MSAKIFLHLLSYIRRPESNVFVESQALQSFWIEANKKKGISESIFMAQRMTGLCA